MARPQHPHRRPQEARPTVGLDPRRWAEAGYRENLIGAATAPDPEPLDLDPLHRAGEAYVNAEIAKRRGELEAARERSGQLLNLQRFGTWGGPFLQMFSGVEIDSPDYTRAALQASQEADRMEAVNEGQADVDRAAHQRDVAAADLRESARYADRLQDARAERARLAERRAREEADAAAAAAEAEREEAASLYGDMIASGLTADAEALYRTVHPTATAEQAAAAVAAAREAHLLDLRGDRALVERREQLMRPGQPASRGSSRSPSRRPPSRATAPTPTGRTDEPDDVVPPGLARREVTPQALGFPDPSRPFDGLTRGAPLPIGEGLADQRAVADALDSGQLDETIQGAAERISALPLAERRDALEALLSDLDSRPGGDLLADALLSALGY